MFLILRYETVGRIFNSAFIDVSVKRPSHLRVYTGRHYAPIHKFHCITPYHISPFDNSSSPNTRPPCIFHTIHGQRPDCSATKNLYIRTVTDTIRHRCGVVEILAPSNVSLKSTNYFWITDCYISSSTSCLSFYFYCIVWSMYQHYALLASAFVYAVMFFLCLLYCFSLDGQSSFWFTVISFAIWSIDHKVVLNLT